MAAEVLVAYATKYGSNREIAEAIAETLREAGLVAEVRSARSVADIERYDAVILGSALYAAHWRTDANRFVKRHLEALQARPVWLFSSGPLDPSANGAHIPISPHVAPEVEPIGAMGHRTFGGRLLPGTGVPDDILATHPNGDFRDFRAIHEWARGIAAALIAEATLAHSLEDGGRGQP
jgi:menaquinone-dependent protoporphyrinogen oxidase